MTPQAIIIALWKQGINVRLTPDRQGLAVPAGCLTADQRALLLTHKTALIAFLAVAHGTAMKLIEAAMLVCDLHDDDCAAREEMRHQCLELPPHLQADALEHFRENTPALRVSSTFPNPNGR